MRRLLILILVVMLVEPSFAQAPAAPMPVAGDWLGGIVSLWGPLLGVIVALVVFCDRLAKVIPNSTTNGVLTVIRKIAAILGAKVPDVQ